MKNLLTEIQKEVARAEVNNDSLDQYYFVVFENTAKHESYILLCYKQQINEMIDAGDLIPFVPSYDL